MNHTDRQKRYDPARIKRRTSYTLLYAGIVSIVIVVGAFLGALWLFPFTRFLPQTTGTGELAQPVDWSLLEGLTGLATLCLVIGGLVFAFIEYRRSAIQDSRQSAQSSFAIYREMYDRLADPEDAAARRWILQNLPTLEEMDGDEEAWLARTQELLNQRPPDWMDPRPPGKAHLKRILNTFDFIGFVGIHYWTIENELVEWMNPVIAKVWERIYFYVEDEARRRNEPDYYQAARDLGDRCLQWRVARGLKTNIIEDAT
jgi:hypothetical protein